MNNLERIQRLRLLDDDFMRVVFKDKDCCQLLLEVILDRKDFEIVTLETQKDLKNLHGKSVCLDIWIETNQKKKINIEVQRNEEGAHPKRARYHASLMDMNGSVSNEKYKDLEEMYVIFITETDVFRKGLPIYHIERKIEETNTRLNDGMHIIYVNAENQQNTDLGRLMHDFQCTNVEDMYYDRLKEQVRYFKEDERGICNMCEIWDEVRQEGREEGIELGRKLGKEEGKEENQMQTAFNLWNAGYQDLEMIHKITELPVEQIKTILNLV